MPLRYGSETAEHQAVRTAAGLFDLSHMGELAVSGPEAAAALPPPGVGCLAAVAVRKDSMVADWSSKGLSPGTGPARSGSVANDSYFGAPVSNCIPFGVKSTVGNDEYSCLPLGIFSTSVSGVQIVTTQSR